jgi:phosphate transport system substrate-binding protein
LISDLELGTPSIWSGCHPEIFIKRVKPCFRGLEKLSKIQKGGCNMDFLSIPIYSIFLACVLIYFIFLACVLILFALIALVFCKNRLVKKFCASFLCLGALASQFFLMLDKNWPEYFFAPAAAYLIVLAIALIALKAKVYAALIFSLAASAQAAAYLIYFAETIFIFDINIATENFYQAIALLFGILVISAIVVIWQPFYKKALYVPAFAFVVIAVATLSCGADYFLNETADRYGSSIDISDYQPHLPESLVKLLDEPSTLSLVDQLPRMNGDIDLYPLFSAFAQATYPPGDYSLYGKESLQTVTCHQDDQISRLVEGVADIAFTANVTEKDYKTASRAGLELKLLPIGKEAFVFMVNSKTRVDGLSQEEAKKIYSGEIWSWSFVKDGKASGSITPYQLGVGNGATESFKKIMSGVNLMKPPKDLFYGDKSTYMSAYAADYRNRKNALGFACRFYIEGNLNEVQRKRVKLLKIDGVEPSIENISSGAYPYSNYFYAVTIKNRPVGEGDIETKARIENTQKLLDWILSEQGQGLVEKTGYSPL